jgi:hypothetical protein
MLLTVISLAYYLHLKKITVRQALGHIQNRMRLFSQHPRWRALLPDKYFGADRHPVFWARAGAVMGVGFTGAAIAGLIFNWAAQSVFLITGSAIALREAFSFRGHHKTKKTQSDHKMERK